MTTTAPKRLGLTAEQTRLRKNAHQLAHTDKVRAAKEAALMAQRERDRAAGKRLAPLPHAGLDPVLRDMTRSSIDRCACRTPWSQHLDPKSRHAPSPDQFPLPPVLSEPNSERG